jgi:uncharacterized protein (TIGR03382 family)
MKRVVLAGAMGILTAAALVHAANEPNSCSNTPVAGATTAADPTHKGQLRAAGPGQASTCGAAPVAPPVQNPTTDYHYRSYTFRNWTSATACMTFDIVYRACDFTHGECAPPPNTDASCAEGGCGGVGLHEAAAYLGAFDPNDIRAGYLGDSGFLSGGPGRDVFSVNAPAGADIVLVVTWAGPVAPAFEPHYSMTVTGCGQPSGDASVGAGDGGVDAGPRNPTTSWPRPTPPPAQPDQDDDDDDEEAIDASAPPKKDAGKGRQRTAKAAPTEESGGCNTSGGSGHAAIALGLFATALILRRRTTKR